MGGTKHVQYRASLKQGGRYTCVGNAEMVRVATVRNLDA